MKTRRRYCFYGLESKMTHHDEGREFASRGGAWRHALGLSRRWQMGVEIMEDGEKQGCGSVAYSASLR